MDIDLKNRLKKVVKLEKQRGCYSYNYINPRSVDEFMRVCREYHTRELNRLSVRDTIKILIHKIVNKFKNK